jgi:UDP-glucose 4-epimerase
LNAGYGHGYSVLEVIAAVQRVSGREFAVAEAPRRPGDIMTMIADASRIRSTLQWTPQFDNLETIASHALAWEQKFAEQQRQTPKAAVSA